MDISGRLKTIRGALTQEEFAKLAGVSKMTVGRWERGERGPDYENMLCILKGFPELNPAWLLTGEGEMERSNKGDVKLRAPALNKDLLAKLIEALRRIDKGSEPLTPEEEAEQFIFFYETLNHVRVKDITVESIVKFITALSSLSEIAVEYGIADEDETIEEIFGAIVDEGLFPGFEDKKHSQTEEG